jgi:hypothetical protein
MKRLFALTMALGVGGCSSSFTDYMVPGYTPHTEPVSTPSATVQPSYAQPQPPSPAASADDLRALTRLRDDGVITEQEYQAKKTEILDRM